MTNELKQILNSGNWMIRFDNNGKSYNNFVWNPVDEWTEAPDWDEKPICRGGLFGQSLAAAGHCGTGSTMVLCETRGKQIEINGAKVKVRYARRLFENENIPEEFIEKIQDNISLDLRNYKHKLPEGFTHCGADLYLGNYKHKLPDGFRYCGNEGN